MTVRFSSDRICWKIKLLFTNNGKLPSYKGPRRAFKVGARTHDLGLSGGARRLSLGPAATLRKKSIQKPKSQL
jgi:hypothetical protein